MRRCVLFSSSLVLAVVAVLAAVPVAASQPATPEGTPVALPPGVEIVAAGLTNPRGFSWGPDGTLYLGLAGVGGDAPGEIAGAPSGLFGGPSASVVRLDDGCPTVVAGGLPSGIWSDVGWVWGVMDVVFLDDQLYALVGGGGGDNGLPEMPNGVYRVLDDGATEIVADLSAWMADRPTAYVPGDYGSDGSLFDMEAGDDTLWITDAVAGRLMTVTPDGEIALVADLSELKLTPTGIALAPDGGAYVGFETFFPFEDETSKVVHVAADGTVTDHWTGLTAVTDVAIGPDGALYAAEMATGNTETDPYLTPSSGRIVRQTGPDSLEEVATDLEYPVALGFAPDGALYVATPAFGPNAGEGQGSIFRLDLSVAAPISVAGLVAAAPAC